MGKIWDKIIKGGEQHQARKAAEKEAKAIAFNEEMKGYKAGLSAGAKKRGFERGMAKGSGRGGLSGFADNFGRSMQAFEKGGNALIGDVNLGGIGGGLATDFGGIGGFGGGGTKRRHRRTSHRKKGRR